MCIHITQTWCLPVGAHARFSPCPGEPRSDRIAARPYCHWRAGSALAAPPVCRSGRLPTRVSGAEQWPLSMEEGVGKEEQGEGGSALLLSICCCPHAWLTSSARAEERPLFEEQKRGPGERVFVIQSLPCVVEGTPPVHVSVCEYWALDAENSRKASVGINARLAQAVHVCPRENNARPKIVMYLRHIAALEKSTQESQADVNVSAVPTSCSATAVKNKLALCRPVEGKIQAEEKQASYEHAVLWLDAKQTRTAVTIWKPEMIKQQTSYCFSS